jgi:hypothetical protein
MNSGRFELPMAIADCALDPPALREQAARYRRLGEAARTIQRTGNRVLIIFEPGVDLELLDAAMATERRCCPFFSLRYDRSALRLSISVADPLKSGALDTLLAAVRAGAVERSSR